MANELTGMEITEISLVDEPANEDAKVVIVKSKGAAQPVTMQAVAAAIAAAMEDLAPEIVAKAAESFSADSNAAAMAAAMIQETVMDMEAIQAALEAAEAAKAEAETALAKARADLAAKDAEIAKLKTPPAPEPSEEEILKGLPESIRKRLEEGKAAEVALAKAKEKDEVDGMIAKAKSLKAGEPEKFGEFLHRIAKGKTTEADVALLEAALAPLVAAMEKSPLFKSLGVPPGGKEADLDDPQAALQAKADEIHKAAGGKLTPAQAYTQAMDENPDLYDAFIAKRR